MIGKSSPTPILRAFAGILPMCASCLPHLILGKGVDCEKYGLTTTLVTYQGQDVIACVNITRW